MLQLRNQKRAPQHFLSLHILLYIVPDDHDPEHNFKGSLHMVVVHAVLKILKAVRRAMDRLPWLLLRPGNL